MQARVRTAGLDDLPAVERVFEACFPALMAGAYDRALLERALPLMIRAQPSLVGSGKYHVAEAEGEVVGCGGWSHEKPGTAETEPGVGHIRHFAVTPDWIGRGVGRAIYARGETQARSQGVRVFECYSSLNGEPFYRALGFSRLAAIEVEMGPEVMFPSIHMRRPI